MERVWVVWDEKILSGVLIGMTVEKQFRTSIKNVDFYKKNLQSNKNVSNIRILECTTPETKKEAIDGNKKDNLS